MRQDRQLRLAWSSSTPPESLEFHAERVVNTFSEVFRVWELPNRWRDPVLQIDLEVVQDVVRALESGVTLRETEPTPIVELGHDMTAMARSGDEIWRLTVHVNTTSQALSNLVLLEIPGGCPVTFDEAKSLLEVLVNLWRPTEANWSNSEIRRPFSRPFYGLNPAGPGWLSWFADGQDDPYEGGEPFAGGTLHTFASEISEDTIPEAIANIRAHTKA